MLFQDKTPKHWEPSVAERALGQEMQRQIGFMYDLKSQSQEMLNMTLQAFWNQSNEDYQVITTQVFDDAVKDYTSSISRDKSDIFIAHLVKQMFYPSVTAQNAKQEIDRVMGKVSRSILEHLHATDGYPSENGHQKTTRYVHKMVVEGTVHIQDDVTKDGLISSLVPNEEILIPNFWQPDIQKQACVARIQENILHDEAAEEFGDLDNWECVEKGKVYQFRPDNVQFKATHEGVLEKDEVQIVRMWWPVPKKELPKGVLRAKYFNAMVNGVLMFPVKTKSPYRDGFYSINKGIFTYHSKPEYYWGNSLPNKMHEEKEFKDNWKTLLRYKGKLSALPPLISKGGLLLDEEIIIPAKTTPIPDGVEVKTIDGVAQGVTNSDVMVMKMVDEEIERGTQAPQTQIDPDQKARSAVIVESNAQILLDSFALQVGFLMMARTYPILMRGFQFLPRRTIKKISVPEQTLPGGRIGTMEIIFEKLPEMTEDEMMERSIGIRQEQEKAFRAKNPKRIEYVDPEYLKELTLYVKAEVGINSLNKDTLEKQRYRTDYANVYSRDPMTFNKSVAARKFIQYNGDDEDILNSEAQMQQLAAPATGEPELLANAQELPALSKLPI